VSAPKDEDTVEQITKYQPQDKKLLKNEKVFHCFIISTASKIDQTPTRTMIMSKFNVILKIFIHILV
jgi:hypothetical protein